MNTNTLPALAIGSPVAIPSSTATSIGASDLAQRKAELEAQLKHLQGLEEQYVAAQRANQEQAIRQVPVTLGLAEGDLTGAIMILKGFISKGRVTVMSTAPATPRSNKGKPTVAASRRSTSHYIPDSVKETAIQMRKRGDSAESIAQHLNVSVASCWVWFRKAGLNNKGLGGRAHRAARGRKKGSGAALVPSVGVSSEAAVSTAA